MLLDHGLYRDPYPLPHTPNQEVQLVLLDHGLYRELPRHFTLIYRWTPSPNPDPNPGNSPNPNPSNSPNPNQQAMARAGAR